METITNWKELVLNSFGQILKGISGTIPNIIGAILILIFGWLFTKLILYIIRKVLRLAKIDRLTDAINDRNLLAKTDFKIDVLNVILGFIKWILYLIFLIVASEIMNWNLVSEGIGNLLIYLPTLFSSIALFLIGLYIANYIKKAIRGLFESFDLKGANLISNLVFYVIAIIVTITALNQAGINTQLITNNLTLVLGALLATFTLAFGLGSREIISDLLKTFYVRKNYEIGQKIKIKKITGTIISINNLSMTLNTENGKIVLPIKEVIENQVEIVL